MPFVDEPLPPPGKHHALLFPEDLISSLLEWTPEILLDEHHYDEDISELPHFPLLQSAEAWKAAYKPAIRVELHSGLCQAIQRPDKLTRPMWATDIEDASIRSTMKTLGDRAVVLKFEFKKDPHLRSQDFVYVSPLAKPWEETAVMCAAGIVHTQTKYEDMTDRYGPGTLNPSFKERWEVFVEVSRGYADALEMLGAGGQLKIILVSSIASGYRIFKALCDPEHSELLMQHILRPGPVENTASLDISPQHADVIEYLAA
jgi:hypothetical protein